MLRELSMIVTPAADSRAKSSHWKRLSKPDQAVLKPHLEELQSIAAKADAERPPDREPGEVVVVVRRAAGGDPPADGSLARALDRVAATGVALESLAEFFRGTL